MARFAGINVSKLGGLSENEAQKRLLKYGPNEIPSAKRRSWLKIAIDVIKEPMIALLIATGIVYLILGNSKEATFLLFSIFVIAGITLYQSHKTERALEALRDLSSPRALVVRDNEIKRIAGRDVVEGDIVIVSEGDRIPADGAVIECANLNIDESFLTGESVPVSKTAERIQGLSSRPGGENNSFAYAGALVTTGWGIIKVMAIGIGTEMGKIGKSLGVIRHERTNLEMETSKIVKTFAVIGFGLCIAVGIIYGITHQEWLGGILNGLALAMAIIPEEFPVILVVFLVLGAWRLSKRNVLTRKTSAIEMLGASTVLCVDKTGTITENKMEVKKLILPNGQEFDVDYSSKKNLPEEFHRLAEYSNLEGHKNPFNPIGLAFQKLINKYLLRSEHVHPQWTLEKEYPLSKELRAVCSVWREDESVEWAIATKGAPEAVIELSHISQAQSKKIMRLASAMAQDGLRVFGVARGEFKGKILPQNPHDFKFSFLGLVGLEDPIRPSVPKAIAECYEAGIRVIMITGDYPETAKSVARQINLDNPEEIILGQDLERMSDQELESKIHDVNICARVVPEQKLRIVGALKKSQAIVAMTGDGVNDAPALKAAHIGIAMGERGTDVAREASSLVLLDDNFSSIVAAVRAGRRIFDNLRRAMSYIVAIHVPIAGLALVPVIFDWPLILYPAHIVFLELIIDPACSVVFETEPEGPKIMKRSPRNVKEPIFNSNTLMISLMQGIAILFLVLIAFIFGLKYGLASGDLRAISFTALIITNLGLIIINLSAERSLFRSAMRQNRALIYILVGAVILLALILGVPFLRDLFSFSRLHFRDIALALGVGLTGIAVTKGIGYLFRRSE